MANGYKPIQVTRREFYGALVVVWLYIMIVIGDLLRLEWRWTTGILWLASFFMVIAYSVQSFRGSQFRGSHVQAALSDRVKQLAGDPARKIEAIQAYREETGAGLAEAKEAIETFINSK